MMHLRGVILLTVFSLGVARRSIRIDRSRHDAQRENNSITEALEMSAETREALLPGGFGKAPFCAQGAPCSRQPFGARRATVALHAASGPEEGRFRPKKDMRPSRPLWGTGISVSAPTAASMSRRDLLAAGVATASGPSLRGVASAAGDADLELQEELDALLRVRESIKREIKLINSDKKISILNIKRDIGDMLNNTYLRFRFVACSIYAQPDDVKLAVQLGSDAVKDLLKIQKLIPDELEPTALDIPEKIFEKIFVRSTLEDAAESIDVFLALMPKEAVKAASRQVERERRGARGARR